MPVIRTSIMPPAAISRRNNQQLLSFSSILSSKYRQGRLSEKIEPSKTNNVNKHTPMDDAWSIRIPSVNEKQKTPGLQQKLSTKTPKKWTKFIPYLIAPVILLVAAGIAAALLGTVFSHSSTTTGATTTTTTSTTTTYTSATTITETTTTTSITTSPTSTSSSSSSTSSSSTSSSSTSSTSSSSATSTTTSVTTTTTATHTTATTTTGSGGCYFGGDQVNLAEGGRRRMDQLQVGDRIWTLTSDGKRMVEDEIVLMMHAEPETSIYFYTFTTIEGQSISLSGSHNLLVVPRGQKEMMLLRASKVTLDHQVLIFNRTVALAKIDFVLRVGFYSPLTLSGYLLVNNISTSVFVDSFHASHETLHGLLFPLRLYYLFTRWIFGKHYNPFWTTVDNGLHPLIAFLIAHQNYIRLLFTDFSFL